MTRRGERILAIWFVSSRVVAVVWLFSIGAPLVALILIGVAATRFARWLFWNGDLRL